MKKILKVALFILAFTAVVNYANATQNVRSEETAGQSLSGSVVTARVKSALAASGLPATKIKVVTKSLAKTSDSYAVTLSGSVSSKEEANRAKSIAAGIGGVETVDDRLKVE